MAQRDDMPTIDELYVAYAQLAGQLAVTTNLAAALAALHSERHQTLERVIAATEASGGYKRAGGSAAAEDAYAEGVQHAVSVFRAAMAGMG
jgi:hypothetical protein